MRSSFPTFLLAGACALLSCGCSERGGTATETRPPNVILIMADDLGYGDLSAYGNDWFETPRLDALAEEGLRFTDFHANGPVCTPTRASLVTGRYPHRAGLADVIYAGFDANRQHGLHPDEELTFAELMKEAGYVSGVFGKWHLGYKPEYNPLHHGFDTFVGFVSGNIDYHSHVDNTGIFDWWHGTERVMDSGYATTLLTDAAIEFIVENRDRPFVAYIAHTAPHWPYQGPSDPPAREAGNPGPLYNFREPVHARRAYEEMVQSMDAEVGRVVDTLRALDLDRETLVLFFSDNGPTGPGLQGPLRGRKGSAWEGGQRVPAVAWWPGTIEPGVTGELTMTMDVMPTMLDLADVTVPPGHRLDGLSLRELLLEGSDLPDRTVFWDWPGNAAGAVRDGPWKLMIADEELDHPALFSLEVDPAERVDVSEAHPDVVRRLERAYAAWREDVTTGATRQPTEKMRNPLQQASN